VLLIRNGGAEVSIQKKNIELAALSGTLFFKSSRVERERVRLTNTWDETFPTCWELN